MKSERAQGLEGANDTKHGIPENGIKYVGDVGGYLHTKEILLRDVGVTQTQLVERDVPVLLE